VSGLRPVCRHVSCRARCGAICWLALWATRRWAYPTPSRADSSLGTPNELAFASFSILYASPVGRLCRPYPRRKVVVLVLHAFVSPTALDAFAFLGLREGGVLPLSDLSSVPSLSYLATVMFSERMALSVLVKALAPTNALHASPLPKAMATSTALIDRISSTAGSLIDPKEILHW